MATDKNHLAFFAGLAPASDPKLVAVVLINDPQTSGRWRYYCRPCFLEGHDRSFENSEHPARRKGFSLMEILLSELISGKDLPDILLGEFLQIVGK